ncbi:MAG: hypothetical protein LJE64_07110 [Desulfofustis sp.]|nr:hypothetical protein [Desulfofustis sp.]
MPEQSHIVIDLRNFVSWFSLLKITQIFDGMGTSEILEINGADAETKQDLFKILPAASYRIIGSGEEENEDGFCQVVIQKTAGAVLMDQ